MAMQHAVCGSPINLNSYGGEKTAAIVKQGHFEVLRVVLEPGKSMPAHKVDGPITVQCLSGTCTFMVEETPQSLVPGSWLFLEGGVMHSLDSTERCILLLTIVFAPSS